MKETNLESDKQVQSVPDSPRPQRGVCRGASQVHVHARGHRTAFDATTCFDLLTLPTLWVIKTVSPNRKTASLDMHDALKGARRC